MRIESVSPFIMHIPVTGNQIADSMHTITHWGVVGARIRSSDGIEGFGFTGTHAQLQSDRLIARLISDLYAPLLIGRGLEEHPSVWQELFHSPPIQWIGRAGLTQLALSAVDVALWDLRAKQLGLPLWAFLGGSQVSRLRAYNTDVGWLSLSHSQLVDMCTRACQAEGFTGIKIKVGQENPENDVRRVEAVRKAVGADVTIAIDANGKFDLPGALRLSRRLEQYDVLWFEEPMWYDDVEAHAQLARLTRIPIALGEQIYTVESLCQFMLRGAVQFVQPDVTRIGGVTPFLRAIASASAQSLQVAPHAGEMSQVHVHLAFNSPSCSLLEYIPWIAKSFLNPAAVRDGYFVKPEAPGAGTTPTEESLESYGKSID
jgi:L-alanine-DL-glutamate epimerase-like enolase superfamily enzyme